MCGCIVHDFRAMTDDDEPEKEIIKDNTVRDMLTGFYSRFYLNEFVNELSQKGDTGITYIDINNLKSTNASLGHSAGDEVIKKVSDMIRDNYSSSMIFRINGDEFVIITSDCTEREFLKLSEDVKKLFSKDNLAAVGYKFCEKIGNIREKIDQCKTLMREHKQKMKDK
jgi:diguanylate cyclase (GGDEF)-like protein